MESKIISGLVSVVMPNYNTEEEYLRSAIESILNQTYSNFEFIIIDDGSTNDSVSIIESYDDERIVLIKNTENQGLTRSLNIALDHCKGDYIARMDSDDVSFPNRFEKQVEYLQKHDNVIVCGTGVECIGDWEKRRPNKIICPTIEDRESYRIHLLLGNRPIITHPSAMLNRKLMLEYSVRYDDSLPFAQDYKLWVSCSQVADCVILPEILLKFRIHDKSITIARRELQLQCHRRIIQDQLDKLHLQATEDVFRYHDTLVFNKRPYDPGIKMWIKTLIDANKKYRIYNQSLLKKILWAKWTKITYYGLVNAECFEEKIRVLFLLSIKNYPKLIRVALSKWRRKMLVKAEK